jgi:hypothetical protein
VYAATLEGLMTYRMADNLRGVGATVALLGIFAAIGGFLTLLELGRWGEVIGWGVVGAGALAVVGGVLFVVGDKAALCYADPAEAPRG